MCFEPVSERSQRIAHMRVKYEEIKEQFRLRKIVGIDDPRGMGRLLETSMVALLTGGHIAGVGVPGTAKSLFVETFADVLDLSHKCVAGNIGLVPEDLVGSYYKAPANDPEAQKFGGMKFYPGPVFANVVHLDEFNRASPRTQGAVLMVMQEGKYITVPHGEVFRVPDHYLVFAVQNSLESEGTFRLTDANTDRFMCFVDVVYPSAEDEFKMLMDTDVVPDRSKLRKVLDAEGVKTLKADLRELYPSANERVCTFVRDVGRASRPEEDYEKGEIV